MIARIIPGAYDGVGKRVIRPFDRRRAPHPTFPMGRYVSQPISIKCASLADVRQFLRRCKPVSDQEQFGQRDYWQPPEDFEKTRKGDCDDFALWTWRQFMDLGYDSRVVFGQHGRYGIGHAWVEYFADGHCYLVEPQLCFLGASLPQLSTLHYHPKFSVAWNGEKLSYYQHTDLGISANLIQVARLLPEYLAVWGLFWMRNAWKIPAMLWRSSVRMWGGFRLPKPKS